jgi:hypothetical protein
MLVVSVWWNPPLLRKTIFNYRKNQSRPNTPERIENFRWNNIQMARKCIKEVVLKNQCMGRGFKFDCKDETFDKFMITM